MPNLALKDLLSCIYKLNEKIYDFAVSSTFHDDNHYGLSNVYPLSERNFFIDFKYTF